MQLRRLSLFNKGFTLIEIVVSTTIFAVVLSLMLTLFNYTLKINRRSESLRQVTQGMRNFTEFLIKEIRNGRIDYGSPDQISSLPVPPCPQPHTLYDTTSQGDTSLGLVNLDGEQECIYRSGTDLMIVKRIGTNTFPAQKLNPPGVSITKLTFYIRPAGIDVNPYNTIAPPRIQPFVSLIATFKVQLSPSDAAYTIPYQTSISTDQYDLPH